LGWHNGMRRVLLVVLVVGSVLAGGCGPLSSVACDRVGRLCTNIDLAACDSEVSLAPPYVRKELLDCTAAAKTCDEAVNCFASRGYPLPTYQPYRY